MSHADKAVLRMQALVRRDALCSGERSKIASMLITYADIICPEPEGIVISAFWPIRSEIDPRALMAYFARKGAHLALPALIDKKNKLMQFRIFEHEDDLIAMGFDTFGPPQSAPVVDPDIILVPLAVFDGRGNRIGYGAGYYDRAIAEMKKKGKTPQLIGLAFDCQKVDIIAHEAHDIPLDAVLTQSGLTRF